MPMNTTGLLLAVSLSALAACSSSSSGGGGSVPGVDSSKKMSDVTSDDLGKICDYYAAKAGGYGTVKTTTCDGGVSSTSKVDANQAACVAKFKRPPASCPITVGQFETCGDAISAMDPCVLSTSLPPQCAPLEDPKCTSSGGTPPSDGGA